MNSEKVLQSLLEHMDRHPNDPKIQKWGTIGLEILREVITEQEKGTNTDTKKNITNRGNSLSTNELPKDRPSNKNRSQNNHKKDKFDLSSKINEATLGFDSLSHDSGDHNRNNPLKNNLLIPEMKQYTSVLLQKSHQLHQKLEKEEIIDQMANLYEEGGKRLKDEPVISSTFWYYWMGTILFFVAYLVIRVF